MTKGKGRNPGAGGLDKHIKRTAHKERSQPASRKHLGALEKHQDYVKRATKRHKKVKKLNELKRAAAQRNPDEYNIKMVDAVMDTASGKMRQRNRKSLLERRKDQELVIQQNQQNLTYLRHQAQHDLQRARQLADDAVGLDLPVVNQHTIFVDDEEEVRSFDPVVALGTTGADMLAYPAVRPKTSMLESIVLPESLLVKDEAVVSAETDAQRRAGGQQDRIKRHQQAEDDEREDEDGDDEEHDEEEEDVPKTLEEEIFAARREQRLRSKQMTVLKQRELAARVQRSDRLMSLAKKVEKQNKGLLTTLNAKKNNKIRKGVNVRSR